MMRPRYSEAATSTIIAGENDLFGRAMLQQSVGELFTVAGLYHFISCLLPPIQNRR